MVKEGSTGGAGALALLPRTLAALPPAEAAAPLAVQGGRLVVGESVLLLPCVSRVAKNTTAGAQALALLLLPALPCKRLACLCPCVPRP